MSGKSILFLHLRQKKGMATGRQAGAAPGVVGVSMGASVGALVAVTVGAEVVYLTTPSMLLMSRNTQMTGMMTKLSNMTM